MPGKRQAGWPSLLVTFLLATQEKSDSAAGGGRKPAAGEHINEVIGLSHRHTAPPHQATKIRDPASLSPTGREGIHARRQNLRHPPQLPIQIPIQPKHRQRHAPVDHLNPLRSQQSTLLPKATTAHRHRDMPAGSQHPIPGQHHAVRDFAKKPSDQTRPARQAGALRDGAIARHASVGDCRDRREDAGVLFIDGRIHQHLSSPKRHRATRYAVRWRPPTLR